MNTQQILAALAGQDTEKLLRAAHKAGGQPTAKEMADATGFDATYVQDLALQLINMKLVVADQSFANEVALTPLGQSIARAIQQSFASGPRRSDAIRRDILRFLQAGKRYWSHELAVEWPGTQVEPHPAEDEINLAMQYLEENNMIKTQGAWGGGRCAFLIKPAGVDALHSPRLLVTGQEATSVMYDQRNQSTNIDQSGANIGAQAFGDGNTVTGNATIDNRTLANVRESLEQARALVPDLHEAERQAVEEAIGDALEEVNEDKPKPRMIRRCVDEGLRALSTSTGTAAGASIVGLLQGVLGSL
jgi:hypothetical protein